MRSNDSGSSISLRAWSMWKAMGGGVAFSHAYLECMVVGRYDN